MVFVACKLQSSKEINFSTLLEQKLCGLIIGVLHFKEEKFTLVQYLEEYIGQDFRCIHKTRFYFILPLLFLVGIHRSDSDMGGVEPPYRMLLRRIKHICENPDNDVWEVEEERDRKIGIVLEDYFLRHQELGTEAARVSMEVRMLQGESLLSTDLKELVNSKAVQYEKQMSDESSDTCSTVSSVGAPEEEPLFSKENVYHALVCCRAVDASDESQVRSVLREHPHSFDGLSVTRSDCKERHQPGGHHGMYVIARKADSTYIVAFKGIPALSEWLTYKSLNEGMPMKSHCYVTKSCIN